MNFVDDPYSVARTTAHSGGGLFIFKYVFHSLESETYDLQLSYSGTFTDCQNTLSFLYAIKLN